MSIREYDRPNLSDDVETAQTIAMMDELADRDAPTRTIVGATQDALDAAGIGPDRSALEKANAIFWYLKRRIRYVHVPGTSPLVDQTLIPPQTLMQMPDPEGDCAQFSMCGNAMLKVCCIQSAFKTIAADPDYPDTYSHVYLMVRIAPNGWMPFDASNGPAPGAEYSRRFKERVWPAVSGVRCKEKPSMVRNTYSRQSATPNFRHSVTHRALGSLFQPLYGLHQVSCDQDGNCYDASTGTYTPASVDDNEPLDIYAQAGITSTATAYPPPAASMPVGANALAQNIASDVTQLATPLVKAASASLTQPYYITNPQTGQSVLYNPATGQTTNPISSALGSLSPTTLGIGLVLILGLAFMGGKK